MIHRLIALLILVPVAVILIALAVANRTPTPFTLDPFQPGNPQLTLMLPLFVWLFAALVLGVLSGSLATWLRQGRYRRAARESRRKAAAMPGQRAPDPNAGTAQGGKPALPARS